MPWNVGYPSGLVILQAIPNNFIDYMNNWDEASGLRLGFRHVGLRSAISVT